MQFNFGSPSKRFWRLVREKDERELTAQELEFLDSHRNQSLEDSSLEIAELRAMEFLRSEQVDPVVRPTFNEGVLREYRLQRMESGAARWKPLLIGAGITAVAFFAILEALSGAWLDKSDWKTTEAANTAPRRGLVFPQPNLYAPDPSNIR